MFQTALEALRPSGNRDFPSLHLDRIDRILVARQLYFLLQQVAQWANERPILVSADSDKKHMVGYLVDEIGETQVEHEQLDSGTNFADLYQRLKYFLEVADIGVIASSTVHNARVSIDPARIVDRVNGTGKRPSAYDGMVESAQKIDPNDPKSWVFLEDVFVDLLSLAHHMRADNVFMGVISQVIAKNALNYPAEYFTEVDFFTGRMLSEAEQLAKYTHAAKTLKMIRKVFGRDVYGLEPHYHQAFRPLIHDFSNSEKAQARLAELLERAKNNKGLLVPLTVATMYQEREPVAA
jgi:hypothetical protein